MGGRCDKGRLLHSTLCSSELSFSTTLYSSWITLKPRVNLTLGYRKNYLEPHLANKWYHSPRVYWPLSSQTSQWRATVHSWSLEETPKHSRTSVWLGWVPFDFRWLLNGVSWCQRNRTTLPADPGHLSPLKSGYFTTRFWQLFGFFP